MKKDSYFFPHFYNARHDRKIKRVMKEHGAEGYAVFFMLLETLREQTDFKFPLADIDLLADEFGVSDATVRSIIDGYNLFEIDEVDNTFYSPKLIHFLQPYIEKTQRARSAANARWEKLNANAKVNEVHKNSTSNANAEANEVPTQSTCNVQNNTNVMQTHNASKANAMQGEIRRKEKSIGDIKDKKDLRSKSNFKPPTFEDVNAYCAERKNSVDPQKFIDHYTANGWVRGKTKIADWKACVRTWEKNESGADTKKSPQSSGNNKFHNFEQHTNSYNNKELESMLRNKNSLSPKGGA